MMSQVYEKKNRVLDIFYRAMKGENLSVQKIADEYHISSKSISRDINEIKNFLAEHRDSVANMSLEYSYQDKCYHMIYDQYLSSKELIAIVKVLIGSRAFDHMQLLEMIRKLKSLTTYQDQQLLQTMINKEMYHYHGVHHDCYDLMDTLWDIMNAIDEKREITITYIKQNRQEVKRKVQPVAVTFSEYYFYLLAYEPTNNSHAKFYRVDRITHMIKNRTKFYIDKDYPFDEGLLKEKIQYMYPGVYQRIVFEFTGPSLQAILDKIPTAKVVRQEGNKSIIDAYVYGSGIKMFLLSQGSWIKVLEPNDFVEEMKQEIQRMNQLYEN